MGLLGIEWLMFLSSNDPLQWIIFFIFFSIRRSRFSIVFKARRLKVVMKRTY